MHLFINPLLPDITLNILDGSKLVESLVIPRGEDFARFPETVIEISEKYKIDQIWNLDWPWAFTRMRIVTLTLSSLTLTKDVSIKGCHFFDLIPDTYRPILRANPSEYLTRDEDWCDVLIVKDELPDGIYCGYGEKNDFTDTKVFVEYTQEWGYIHDVFLHIPPASHLEPLYIKAPHITWSKKNTSLSSDLMKR